MLVNLNKRSNSNTEWGKMVKRSSNSKEISPTFKWRYPAKFKFDTSINQWFVLIVTKSIEVFQCLKQVKFFDVGKLEHVKNLWNFETRIWSHFIKPYQLFFTVWFDKSWSIDINIRMKTWLYASKIPLSDLVFSIL